MSYNLSNEEIQELEQLNASEMIQRLAITRYDLKDIILQQKKDEEIIELKRQLATLKDEYKRDIDQKQAIIEMIIKIMISAQEVANG